MSSEYLENFLRNIKYNESALNDMKTDLAEYDKNIQKLRDELSLVRDANGTIKVNTIHILKNLKTKMYMKDLMNKDIKDLEEALNKKNSIEVESYYRSIEYNTNLRSKLTKRINEFENFINSTKKEYNNLVERENNKTNNINNVKTITLDDLLKIIEVSNQNLNEDQSKIIIEKARNIIFHILDKNLSAVNIID